MDKVIFYIDSMQKGGGANRVMAVLTKCFAENGCEVALITDVGPKSEILEYEISDLVKRFCLDDIEGEKISSNLDRIKTIRSIIKQEKPDVVVSFMGPPNIRMLLATIGLRTRKIISVRNDPKFEYGTGISKFLKSKIISLADGYVFQTEDAAKYFSKKVQKKSKVIFNPVRSDFFGVERSKTPRNILSIGRLDTQKNQKLLIKAFAKICDEFSEENLIIYGEGPLRNELLELIKDLNIEGRVMLPGSTDDVKGKLAEAKIFVLPSDFEGMPNALMEAMTVGVPVISTDCPCGGPKAMITNDKEGRLVPCRDADAMAVALRKILLNSDLRNEMSYYEKERANSFNIDVIFEEWKNYLEKEI